jgi:hypothetical protein
MTDNKGRETMKSKLALIGLAAIFTSPAFGQGVDPYIGTWKFNLEKSTWIGTPAPKSQTMIYTGDGKTLTGIIDFIDAQGGTGKQVFTMTFDGQPHPSTGSPNYDSTVYIRFGNTINQVYFKDGKAVLAGQSRIDSDKQFTFTAEGTFANGPQRRVLVWDRQ